MRLRDTMLLKHIHVMRLKDMMRLFCVSPVPSILSRIL